MINYMHTRAWDKVCWQDQDHQAHVKTYWRDQFDRAAAIGDAKITNRPEPRQALNGIRNWYEQGYASPTAARYPSFKEDPTAYMLAGD